MPASICGAGGVGAGAVDGGEAGDGLAVEALLPAPRKPIAAFKWGSLWLVMILCYLSAELIPGCALPATFFRED